MRKSLEYKILVSVLALGILSINNIVFANSGGYYDNYNNYIGSSTTTQGSGAHVIIDTDVIGDVSGGKSTNDDPSENNIVEIKGGTIGESLYGGQAPNGSVKNNQVIFDSNDIVIIKGGWVYAGIAGFGGTAEDNSIIIKNGNIRTESTSYGFLTAGDGKNDGAYRNNIIVENGKVETLVLTAGQAVGGDAKENSVIVKKGTIDAYTIYGGYSSYATTENNTVEIQDGDVKATLIGGYSGANQNKNFVNAINNNVIISGGVIHKNVYGGYIGEGNGNATGNKVFIKNNAVIDESSLYGGYIKQGNGDVITDNTLTIDNWNGNVKSVQNFSNIEFTGLKWQNDGTVLNITANDKSDALKNTIINHESMIISGGNNLAVGDSMTLIKGQNLGITDSNVVADGTFSAGVAVAGTGEAQVAADGNSVSYTVTSVKMLDQIDLVAENRAVAAAFVNQGTDLINDSLDVLSRDGKYGIKTFAAVHGNRSKYDVNSDLKINGWSSIVGVGNEKNIGNGDFSWGVFYENGSGNYRTYNEFNNEFFRGDGSLVYNGGGIAARFEQDNGFYTEGSLRAGMLKSEMTNALKDGAGNSYGYKSESTYYGAHIGAGKIISLNEATDLDVYGKFFHTYTDGDSFTVANDKFEFDSITSDRLRIGARLTTNKENKFSTYYGLAYEYEFNGDAQMRAQNMSAPEQSLRGSSYLAEIGMNYKPGSESPWSFDLNMRGYAGQRDGFSGNVQATYTF